MIMFLHIYIYLHIPSTCMHSSSFFLFFSLFSFLNSLPSNCGHSVWTKQGRNPINNTEKGKTKQRMKRQVSQLGWERWINTYKYKEKKPIKHLLILAKQSHSCCHKRRCLLLDPFLFTLS